MFTCKLPCLLFSTKGHRYLRLRTSVAAKTQLLPIANLLSNQHLNSRLAGRFKVLSVIP